MTSSLLYTIINWFAEFYGTVPETIFANLVDLDYLYLSYNGEYPRNCSSSEEHVV